MSTVVIQLVMRYGFGQIMDGQWSVETGDVSSR